MKVIVAIVGAIMILMGCSSTQGGAEKIRAEQVQAWLEEQKEFILLDVRTIDEYNEQHIPTATLLPLDELELSAETVLTDLNQPIVIYCRSGNRSLQAANKLIKLGYTEVYDLGGINNWPYEVE